MSKEYLEKTKTSIKQSIKHWYMTLESSFMKIAPFLVAGLGLYVINTYCNEQATTLILFLTLIIGAFYVQYTYRIAKASELQARISWTFHMFTNFSSRIDALNKFLRGNMTEPWETHKDDMMRYFNVFLKLFATKKGQLYIKEKEQFFKTLSHKKESKEPIDKEMIDFLTKLKEELQWKIIDLS
jgi:hypothetical protein